MRFYNNIVIFYYIDLGICSIRIRNISLSIAPILLNPTIIDTIFFFQLRVYQLHLQYMPEKTRLFKTSSHLLCRLREVHRYDYYRVSDKNFPLCVKSLTSYLDFVRMKTPWSDDVQPRADIYSTIHFIHPFPGFDLSWFLLFPFCTR